MSAVEKKQGAYSVDATQRCERVLGSVLRGVGAPWRERIFLVGGLVPQYLVPQPENPFVVGHIGSTDVDLALRLAVDGNDEGAYTTLETNLRRVGLDRLDGASWRWTVDVGGKPVVVEFLGDDGETESGTLFAPKVKPSAGAGKLGLLCVRGVELAAIDYIRIEREIEMLDGARSSVEIRVAGLLPFVVLKADAYLDRREPKDVYDLLYVIRNWPEGPRSAAEEAQRSPVMGDKFALSALDRLSGDFASRDHAGPRDYSRFVTMDGVKGDMGGAQDEALLIWRQFQGSLLNRSTG